MATPNIDQSLEDRFDAVFKQRLWGDEGSVSGPGSRLDNPMVIDAMKALQHTFDWWGITSIADIPCGDFVWMHRLMSRNPQVSYVGYDIVRDLIMANTERFGAYRFRQFDIVSAVPPYADMVFVKELFIHLTFEQIFQSLLNIKASGSRHLMVSTSFGVPNIELEHAELGYARPIDLSLPPFNLPAPHYRTEFYACWRLAHLSDMERCFDR